MGRGDDMAGRWLSIIGIGEDGRAGLPAMALELIERAELVVGGARHLTLVGKTTGEQMAWGSPLEQTIPAIMARRGRPVAVLASGDPFWFGAGVTLARHVPPEEFRSIPSPSAFSLAANRLGWALQDVVTIGLNSRPVNSIVPHLHGGARILALSAGPATPLEIAAKLVELGFGKSRLTVLEALGGPDERIRAAEAGGFDLLDVEALNLSAIAVIAGPNARPIVRAPGLPDDMFEHDGQITKREIRAVTLSSLAPKPGEHLWDVGLGSGSIAIEWLLAHPATTATGFEHELVRFNRAVKNARALGVHRLDARFGAAPEVFARCRQPDAVFVGGGASSPGVMDGAWAALKPGGRMVVNAVTLETEALLFGWHALHGGSLTRIAIERVEMVGRKRGWRPGMPVTQWAGRKP